MTPEEELEKEIKLVSDMLWLFGIPNYTPDMLLDPEVEELIQGEG